MICVFTPLSHTGNQYIQAAWETLKTQTLQDFLWVVLENHGGSLPKEIRKDPRVRCFGDSQLQGIGALKRRCCEIATELSADIFLELDHDDLLHESALEKAVAALADADFAYSDTAEFVPTAIPPVDPALFGSAPPPSPLPSKKNVRARAAKRHLAPAPRPAEIWLPNTFGKEFGWSSYEVTFQGHRLLAQPQPPVTPQNIRLIDFAPNHFRAFRKEAYWIAGGHRADLDVADDHALMLSFFLLGMRFKHVPECLYFYRVHSAQTTNASQKNGRIRELTEALYRANVFALADDHCRYSWSGGVRTPRAQALRKIDLCGGIDTQEGYEPLDMSLGHDLDEVWPLENDSVGVIRAYDAIEHLKDPIHTMNEAYRVLAPGGLFLILVPSTDGRGAFQDPTHVSFWNQNSFWYYTKKSHARYVPGLTARFQVARLHSFFPNNFCRENSIPYVEAHLIALKDGYEPMGSVEI